MLHSCMHSRNCPNPTNRFKFVPQFGSHWFQASGGVGPAPIQVMMAVNAAIQFFEQTFWDPITLYVNVDYGFVAGSAISTGLAASQDYNATAVSLADIKKHLTRTGSSVYRNIAVSSAGSLAQSPTLSAIEVSPGTAKVWGLAYGDRQSATSSSNPTNQDGYMGFISINTWRFGNRGNSADAFAACIHEFSENMGRFNDYVPSFNFQNLETMYVYKSAGVRSDGTTSPSGWFSIDQGATLFRRFESSGDPNGDWPDSPAGSVDINGPSQPHDAFGDQSGFAQYHYSWPDRMLMDVLGYNQLGPR